MDPIWEYRWAFVEKGHWGGRKETNFHMTDAKQKNGGPLAWQEQSASRKRSATGTRRSTRLRVSQVQRSPGTTADYRMGGENEPIALAAPEIYAYWFASRPGYEVAQRTDTLPRFRARSPLYVYALQHEEGASNAVDIQPKQRSTYA